MTLEVPPDVAALIERKMRSSGLADPLDAIRLAFEEQDAIDRDWVTQIESGYRQAEEGQLTTASAARAEIEAMKAEWRSRRPS
jgi:hypothetical protein